MSEWHTDQGSAQADAIRRARLTNRTHYVYMDGGSFEDETEPAYLVSDREPTAMPPGAVLTFTGHDAIRRAEKTRWLEHNFGD